MSITTVRVLRADDASWVIETDAPNGKRVAYPCRGAAIAAGVHLAMQEDAVLMIHGVGEQKSEFDFSGDESPTIN